MPPDARVDQLRSSKAPRGADIDITVEHLSDEIRSCYSRFDLARGQEPTGTVDWAFDLGPGAPSKFAVARRDGQIIGLSANIRRDFSFGDRTGVAYQAVDSVVAAHEQGHGVFTRLAAAFDEHAAAEGAHLIWGFPNANSTHAWFNKLGWRSHGEVPFLVKPLRAGYFTRKIGLSLDFPISRLADRGASIISEADERLDGLWDSFRSQVKCAVPRTRAYLSWRLFRKPGRPYRIIFEPEKDSGSLVASRIVSKHGGSIAYIMEAIGGNNLADVLRSELGWMRQQNAEVVLAWCFPWSPNYRAFRRAGFYPFPRRLRPIKFLFGCRAHNTIGEMANDRANWYLSYLDSDGM